MNQGPTISWLMVASVLGSFAFILCGLLWSIGKDRWDNHEKKIQRIITHLVLHAENDEKSDLRNLLNGD